MAGYRCVVCVKQVPDTAKVTGKAMKEDGTINRAALPAIFNPDDRNALEAALQVKDRFGGTVMVVTMGLPAATAVLRESLYRGADEAYLVTDRKAAGSDTLATSYILSQAVKKLDADLVFCGRQAIDGDTAQTGPQIAEKLGIPALTYTEALDLDYDCALATRDIGTGIEKTKVRLPALFTVTEKYGELRPADVRRIMQYKNAEPTVWSCDDIGCEAERCGFAGSPTSVNKIESVVLAGRGFKEVGADDESIAALVSELKAEHTIG